MTITEDLELLLKGILIMLYLLFNNLVSNLLAYNIVNNN